MLQLVREYSVEVYLLGESHRFELKTINIGICADVLFAERDGYDGALHHLNGVIQQFLKLNWQRRWIVSTAPEQQYAKHVDMLTAFCPLGATPNKIAAFLLETIEVYLRDSGLLVRDVQVRVGELGQGRATLDPETAFLYERELGAEPDAHRRTDDPFSPHEPIAERGLGRRARYSALPMPARP